MSFSAARSTTQTSTLTRVVYVTRKLQADFLAIMETYGYFSEEYARKLTADLRTFLDNEVIDHVKFAWQDVGTNVVIEELRYTVIAGGLGLADDPPGGIRYNAALRYADFAVYVQYNDRWRRMSADQVQAIRDDLLLSWGPGGRLDYSNGSWEGSGRTYSQNRQDGLSRQRFGRF